MGCTNSQPVEQQPVSPKSNGGEAKANLHRSDSGGSQNSSKHKRRNKQTQSLSPSTNSQKPINEAAGASPPDPPEHTNTNGVITPMTPSKAVSDPHWIQLWKTHQPLLLDPADVHSAIEDFMARSTNKLSASEFTFLQRKIRGIVQSSAQAPEKNRIIPKLKGGNGVSSQEQETRAIAERYHLLSNHVIKKVLPSSSVVDSTFLLLLYCHESLWDRVADIAAESAKAADLVMDVNKYKPVTTVPAPSSRRLDEPPEVPPGVSFQTLTFFIGMALRTYDQ